MIRSKDISKRLRDIDRWVMNLLFLGSRTFVVTLDECCDEFGSRFGHQGDHFFVRALAEGEDFETVFRFLKDYYATHRIRSFNETIGSRIADPIGDQYFCPWEEGRVRPLSNFNISHKAGPTSDSDLERIVRRLLGVLAAIRRQGFTQLSKIDAIPRVIAVVDRMGRKRYIVRDGQHRAGVLSHLGYDTIRVCYDYDYWIPSPLYRFLGRLAGKAGGDGAGAGQNGSPRVVHEAEVDSWPHVVQGRVTPEEALTYFRAVFDRSV